MQATLKPFPKVRVVLPQGYALLAAEPPLGLRVEPAVSVYGEPVSGSRVLNTFFGRGRYLAAARYLREIRKHSERGYP